MIDDSSPPSTPFVPEEVPQFITRIRDPESVAPASLLASLLLPLVSDIEKVLGLIVERIGAIEKKFGYMQDVIEGRKPNIPRAGVGLAPVPASSHTPNVPIAMGSLPMAPTISPPPLP
jgi:hypothetical protein